MKNRPLFSAEREGMTMANINLFDSGVNIKVIGVGGGGNNAVKRMIDTNIEGVEFIAVNTDTQALGSCPAQTKLVIGEKITKGHGAGADATIGQRAAEENTEDIKNLLSGADMVFIAAGMGGGTGTGAAPVVARIAHELEVLTVAIITKPFMFEGRRRMLQAEAGIQELSQYVDSLVIIPNERLKQVSDNRITLSNAFEIADDVLRRGVQSISELINGKGFINLDFADVTAIMHNAGYAHMGVGAATGKDKAEIAAKQAISSPLLETSIRGATGILINITISPDVGLEDAEAASAMITEEAHPDANIIWGVVFDPELDDEMKITIIATGFDHKNKTEDEPKPAASSKQAQPQQPANAAQAAAQLRNPVPPRPAQQPAAAPAPAPQPKPAQPAAPAPKPAAAPAQKPAQPAQPQPAARPANQAPQDGGIAFDDLLRRIEQRRNGSQ